MRRLARCLLLALIAAAAELAPGIVIGQTPLPVGPMEAPARQMFLNQVTRNERGIIDEYDEHTRDPQELRERAREFISLAKQAEQGIKVDWSREKFYEAGQQLLADGSRDPLVVAMAMQTLINLEQEDHEQIVALCQQAIKDVVETYEPRQQVDVIRYCQHVEFGLSQVLWRMRLEKRTKYDFKRSDQELLDDAFVRWMEVEAGSLERQRYVWQLVAKHYLNPTAYAGTWLLRVAEKSRDKEIHPWMRHMLDAHVAMTAAKKLVGRADEEGYKAHFRDAAENYLAAWKLTQAFPEPAAELLRLARGKYVEGTPRDWFDYAVKAEVDNPDAFNHFRTYLRSQGNDALIAFGIECAATKRFDTNVPFELLQSLWAVENETSENVWARPGIYEHVRDLCQNALRAPKHPGIELNEALLNATQLVIAARANRLEDIEPLWEKTDTATLKQVAQIYRLETPLPALKAAAAAAASDRSGVVSQVENSLAAAKDQESLARAAEQIESAAAKLDAGSPLVAQWRSTLALYQDFYAGRWATVLFPPDLPTLAGTENWTREDEHTLVARGCEELPLVALTRLPAPLELSVEIATLEMPDDVPLAGVQIGRREPVPNQSAQGGFFGLNSATREAGMNHYGLARFGTASFKETNELRIRVWYGYCELFLNGARLTATYSLNFHPGDHLSLWAPGTPDARPEVRFSNLKVRPLAFGPPPGRKMPLERIEYFTERMADEPDNPLHRLDRADARFSVGKLAEAIDDYDQLLKANKDWQQVILKKGMAHADAGAYATAIEHYKRLLELPAIEEVHVTGNRFDSDGKWKQTLVRVPLYQVAALDRLAWLEATCQDAEFRNGKSAVEHAKQAIELSQKQNRECYLTLAAAYAEASNFAEARKVIKQAGQLAGKSQQALIAPIQAALDEKRPYREAAR